MNKQQIIKKINKLDDYFKEILVLIGEGRQIQMKEITKLLEMRRKKNNTSSKREQRRIAIDIAEQRAKVDLNFNVLTEKRLVLEHTTQMVKVYSSILETLNE